MPEIPEMIARLRTKFPAVFSSPVRWEAIKSIANSEGEEAAEKQARNILANSAILSTRNKTAIRHRILRRDYLRFQRDVERNIADAFLVLSNRLSKMLLNSADSSGTIPLHKFKGILKRLKKMNTEAFRDVGVFLSGGVRKSINFGLTVSMDSAQSGIEFNKSQTKETRSPYMTIHLTSPEDIEWASAIEAEKTAVIAKTSTIFKTIFDRVKKRRIKQGLFKNRFRNMFQSGHSLSQAVWDLRDGNLRRLRTVVSSGIAQGKAATSMASAIKQMTTVWTTAGQKRLPAPGRGVYGTAYKNALRLTRTETNNAYHEAELEYARHKGFKKMWNLSAGHTNSDECDSIATGGPTGDGIYPADQVPSLPHANCSCYLTTVIPGIS